MVRTKNHNITLALYNPCGRKKSLVMPIERVDATPAGRHYCHEVIRFFDEEAAALAITYNLGAFNKTHAATKRHEAK